MRLFLFVLVLLIPSRGHAEWFDFQPIRKNGVGTYGDITSHANPEDVFVDPDLITSGHETLHVIHSKLRIKHKVPNAYYLLNNRAFKIKNPPIKLKTIADNIPTDKRGRNYSLYLVEQQKYWNDTPFYVLDEYIAYVAGCSVGLNQMMEKRSIDSWNHVVEFQVYVNVAREQSRLAGFSEQKDLDEFLDYVYNNRVLWLEQEYKKLGWLK